MINLDIFRHRFETFQNLTYIMQNFGILSKFRFWYKVNLSE